MKKYQIWFQPLYVPILCGLGYMLIYFGAFWLIGEPFRDTSYKMPMAMITGLFTGTLIYIYSSFRSRVPIFLSMGCTRRELAHILACERFLFSVSCAFVSFLFLSASRIITPEFRFPIFLSLLFSFLLSMDLSGLIGVYTLHFSKNTPAVLLMLLPFFISLILECLLQTLITDLDIAGFVFGRWYILTLLGLITIAGNILLIPFTKKKLSAYTVKV